MLCRRTFFSCVAFHGCLYAIGGRNRISSKLSTEKYDPAEDTWTVIPGMNFHSYKLNAEVIDDTIFVIGGYYDEQHYLSRFACFNDKGNRWYLDVDMNVYRSQMSTCVIENLPNASDYSYKHRDKLMEEKRKKMLDCECNRPPTQTCPSTDVATSSNPVAWPALDRLKHFALRCEEWVKGAIGMV
ncbi:Kelch-like protein 10 [Zootermopsis nevadensis]|uniref:Kelch-like protein 10 n=2 Tax=Zootermopsis nevadensis TaxID=136037 RepID=A0A067RH66_ZOONE|nr:Kelch-like protein 10 [Zootermopsis nevadensis]